MTKVSEFSSPYFPRLVLKIGKFQPSVAYKSVAYKIKSVYLIWEHSSKISTFDVQYTMKDDFHHFGVQIYQGVMRHSHILKR